MNKNVLIMRGLPGSGKSTWLEQNHPDATVCSADHYFMDNEGGYNFDVSKLGEAHDRCYKNFNRAIIKVLKTELLWQREGYQDEDEPDPAIIAIDNTNTQLWEFFGYVQLARYHGFKVIVHQFTRDLENERIDLYIEKCHERCIHGVPIETISRMQRESQKIPQHWDVQVVDHCGDSWYNESDHEEGYDTFRKQSHDATSDSQSEVHNT